LHEELRFLRCANRGTLPVVRHTAEGALSFYFRRINGETVAIILEEALSDFGYQSLNAAIYLAATAQLRILISAAGTFIKSSARATSRSIVLMMLLWAGSTSFAQAAGYWSCSGDK